MSVDMLDTGIDVPEIVNLVFFKPVRSKTKFWQMVGRGTRLCSDLYGPGQDKTDFLIFDLRQLRILQPGDCSQRRQRRRVSEVAALQGAVQLILELAEAQGEGDGTVSDAGLRTDIVELLREQLRNMNVDNFLVRPQRQWVERYRNTEPWTELEVQKALELAARVADLPTTLKEDDEEAKRFDLIILKLQLARLLGEPGEERLRRQVQEIASGLLEQTAIPAIKAEQALLDELAGDDWWVDVTLPMLEFARRHVRGLVRLLEKRKRIVVYTDFTDELGELEDVELRAIQVGDNYARFRDKARAYLREHQDHVALQKLRRNLSLTPTDLDELEQMLIAAGHR